MQHALDRGDHITPPYAGDVTEAEYREAEMTKQNRFKRVEIYRGHVIITDGACFMRFWSEARFPSLHSIKAAIDAEAANA